MAKRRQTILGRSRRHSRTLRNSKGSVLTNRCVLILPYYGAFKNYFPLFLRTCGTNPSFDWLLVTDIDGVPPLPTNVHLFHMSLEEFRFRACEKLGIEACLPTPYKLCDYKPTFGLIFEDEIAEYDYWGHCDCDLLFGDLAATVGPILDEGCDKVFALGHLTLYRNDSKNNRFFMSEFRGGFPYRDYLTRSEPFAFDEDGPCPNRPSWRNVHIMFLEGGKDVFSSDLSMNALTSCNWLARTIYNPITGTFVNDMTLRRYYWFEGKLVSLEPGGDGTLVGREYPYMHLQGRKMRMTGDILYAKYVEVLPDRFRAIDRLPTTLRELSISTAKFSRMRPFDQLVAKVRRRLRR